MATLEGSCPRCDKPITAFVSAEDLRPEGESGFAAWFGIAEVTCPCGGVLGQPDKAERKRPRRHYSSPSTNHHREIPGDGVARGA